MVSLMIIILIIIFIITISTTTFTTNHTMHHRPHQANTYIHTTHTHITCANTYIQVHIQTSIITNTHTDRSITVPVMDGPGLQARRSCLEQWKWTVLTIGKGWIGQKEGGVRWARKYNKIRTVSWLGVTIQHLTLSLRRCYFDTVHHTYFVIRIWILQIVGSIFLVFGLFMINNEYDVSYV